MILILRPLPPPQGRRHAKTWRGERKRGVYIDPSRTAAQDGDTTTIVINTIININNAQYTDSYCDIISAICP